MANKETIDKLKTLLEGHCYPPLKEAAEKYLEYTEKVDAKIGETFEGIAAKADDANEKFLESELADKLKEGIATVDEMIDLFGSKEGIAKFGEEASAKILQHAEELKAKGEKFCDCDACKKARDILEALGEKLD